MYESQGWAGGYFNMSKCIKHTIIKLKLPPTAQDERLNCHIQYKPNI